MNEQNILGLIAQGINVYSTELATITVPARKSLNKRLQKKFIKRYGMVTKPGCYISGSTLLLHPVIFDKLIRFKP